MSEVDAFVQAMMAEMMRKKRKRQGVMGDKRALFQ